MDDRRDRLRALGELLRRLRKDAGLTGKDLASRAGVTQPTISQIETGQLLPLPETVERLVEALELSRETRAALDALLARLREEVSRLKGGLAGRESANAARMRAAHRVASFQSAMIPALLQTAEYARLALSIGRDVDEEAVSRAAAVRVEMQSILFQPGREFSFVLTEGAVRTWPGPASLMQAQLDRLGQASTLPHVRVGVVPWSVQVPRFPLHGFTIFDGSASMVESLTAEHTLTDVEDVRVHVETFEAFAGVAVYGEELRSLLGRVAAEFRQLDTQPK
ncbi:helix-turn-helix transcriptional regulator [Nonomuraea africana]|uniref:Transcriptional regulator with XRE-family HTH domain n=1 Tax=Nonomuraea africana TaxID=46171 RepID=A0ABR9KR10_9ACTN|nr:helix-turn-helix transcriptional regulator [Nonomuraea africana]MBE1564457.1 transcriptional regulator with XRE-family HTH domain [Nonomuraea africana]